MDTLWRDVRYGIRALLSQPVVSVTAGVTLAIGLAVSAVILAIVQTVLFKPLPYADPDELVMLWERQTNSGALLPVAPANFVDWRTQAKSLDKIVALNPFPELTLTAHGEPQRLAAAAVSADFFPLLGLRAALGRTFEAAEEQPGRNLVAMLSYAAWQRYFGGDPAIVGTSVTLNDSAFTVIGVLPRGFQFVGKDTDFEGRDRFDLWIPLALNLQSLQRGTHPLRVFARLRPGTTLPEAQAELDVLGDALARQYPAEDGGRGIAAVGWREQVAKDVQPMFMALLVAVALVLLLTCVNVGNLLLSRAFARQKEMSVRCALGADRLRLARQMITESVLLATAAATLATTFAWTLLTMIVPRLPASIPRAEEIVFDARVFLPIALVSLVAGVAFGCAPLLRRADATHAMREARHSLSRGALHARSVLVVTQVALACMLLVGAGLALRTLQELLRAPRGFTADHVLTAQLTLPLSRYREVPRIAAFQNAVLEGVGRLPGVRSAGIGAYLPLRGTNNSWAPAIEGQSPLPAGEYIQYRPATPGYLEALGIARAAGRGFSDADDGSAPDVAIVNQAAADRYWPNTSALGHRLQIGGAQAPWRTIVGVVENVRHEGLGAAAKPELYLPFAQLPNPSSAMTIVVRTAGEPLTLAAGLRRAVAEIDPGLPVTAVQPMEQIVSTAVGEPRFRAWLLGAFGAIALTLASIGVYGVMSYFVRERTRELAIRMALGARARDLLRHVFSRSIALVAAGLALGLGGSFALAGFMRGLLWGVTPYDWRTFAVVSLVLAAVAMLASYLPGRRASLVDPIEALRAE